MTQAMRFDVSATDRASAAFLKLAENVERLEQKLRALDRVKAEPTVKLDTKPAERDLTAFEKKLQRTFRNLPKAKLEADVDGLTAAERKIDDLKAKMASLSNAQVRVDVDVADSSAIAALQASLATLSNASIRVDLDAALARADIEAIASRMQGLRDVRIKLDVDTADALLRVTRLEGKMGDLRLLSPLRLRIELIDHASGQLAAIQAAANALAASSPSIQVDADTAAALAQLAAVATALGALGTGSTTVRVQLDQTTFLGELARIQTQLNTLAGGTIEINTDTNRAMQELAQLRVRLAELSQQEQTVVVRADTALARHQIELLERQLADIARRQYTAKVDVDKDGKVSGRILALGAAALYAIPALGALGSSAASLGGSLVALSGVAGLLPGVFAAGGAAIGTLVVGMQGFGDALKNRDDAAKFAESIKELAPAARETAVAIRDMGPAWKSMQLETQQRLFAGLGSEMQKLSSAYLPSMRSGMGGISDQFNGLAKDFVGFATSARTVGDVDLIFRNTASAIEAARPAAINLASAFKDIAVVGTGMLPKLASGFTDVTGRFRDFIAEARTSGQLEEWIQGGLDTLKQLGSVAGNVGSILGSVFTAAKGSGADFLTTLDRITEGVADFMRSGEGQSTMIAFFTEARAAIDAILPGLATLARGAAEAIKAFSETGALREFGQAFTDVADAVAPLLPSLGKLAGEVLSGFASAATTAAGALKPIVQAAIALLDAMGPLGPAIVAAVVAFKGLQFANAAITGLGVAVAGMAGRMGQAEDRTRRVSTVFSRMGSAIPILGAAFIAMSAAIDSAQEPAEKLGQILQSGSGFAGAAVKQYDAYVDSLRAGNPIMGLFVDGSDEVIASLKAQEAAMGPVEKAQLAVTQATTRYNEAANQFTANSPQAKAAAAELAGAKENLARVEGEVADATRGHTDALKAQTAAMQSQIGSALAYEESVRATAEAHKAAEAALKESGASSDEYKASVTTLTQAMLRQAESAQAQGEALGGVETGLQAFNTEILRAADLSSQSGRDAFIKLAGAMDTAGLASLSATAQMSGLKTEIVTLPDGRTVTVVVNADRGKLDTVVSDLNSLAAMKIAGTVTINGDPTPFLDGVMQSVTFANGQRGFVRIDGNDAPVRARVGDTKYTIDATTGVMTIDGNVAPGDANLSGFKMKVDKTTGKMTIEANASEADAVIQNLISSADNVNATITINGNTLPAASATNTLMGLVNGSTGTIKIGGDTLPAGQALQAVLGEIATGAAEVTINGHTVPAQQALQMILTQIDTGTGTVEINGQSVPAGQVLASLLGTIAGSTGTVNLDANPKLADGKLDATLTRADGSTGTITIDGNAKPADGKTTAAVKFADGSTGTITIDGNQNPANGKITATVRFADGSTGTVQVNANTADAQAKIAALQRPTSSTHTVRVTTTGQPIGAYHGAAIGGIVKAMAHGGVVGMADGGALNTQAGGRQVKLTPMSGGIADVVAPNTWRVIGDRVTGDEFFIPDNEAPRSMAIGKEWARRRGMALIPAKGVRMMATGGVVPADDDSFAGNSYHSKNRGKAGAVQAEDGSWVMPSFYGKAPTAPSGGGSVAGGTFPMAALTVGFSMAGGGILGRLGGVPAAGRRPSFGASTSAQPGGAGALLTQMRAALTTGATQSNFGPVVAALRRVEVASAANQQVAAKLDLLVQTIERRGAGASITVNDRSGDPSETARSAMLAIRLS